MTNYTPVKGSAILPIELKSLSAIKLFLSLFYTQEKSGVHTFYEVGSLGSRLHRIEKPYLKVYQEIESSILDLLIGKTAEEETKTERKRSHEHTICMLMLLKQMFRESKRDNYPLIDLLDLHPSPEFLQVNRGSSIGPNVNDIAAREWHLSYPLLLVQAVRFSQWESDNLDYCFEFFTARRATQYLFKHINECLKANSKLSCETFQSFSRLIRWHTLEGQYQRATATFGIDQLHNKQYLSDIEKILLYIFSSVDEMARKNGSRYEDLVISFLDNWVNDLYSVAPNILEELRNLNFVDKEDNCYSCYKRFMKKPNEDQGTPPPKTWIIFSYTVPAGKKIELMTADEKFEYNKLKKIYEDKAAECMKQEEDRFNISHIIVDRFQRGLGLLDKILEGKKTDNISEQIECVVPGNTLSFTTGECQNTWFPPEKIARIAFKPEFVAATLYGLSFAFDKVSDRPAIDFLRRAFLSLRKKGGVTKRLPLPMVKRITDLLSYYKLWDIAASKPPDHAFPLRISFDHGKAEFVVWLPELQERLSPESDRVDDASALTVTGILVRYIHSLVSNYGMTCQYNHVDLDFSGSHHFQYGPSFKWHRMLVDPAECSDCKENLGFDVFDRYLIDVGMQKLETSFSIQRYLDAIKRRKSTEAYSFETSERKLGLNAKYILGIDIGATGIKLKFYEIADKEPIGDKKDSFMLSKTFPEKTQYYINPVKYDEVLLEFSMPTFPPEKAGKPGQDPKYEDAADFAGYIVSTLWKRLEKFGEETRSKCFDNLLSVGFCWPGPIQQNAPASTSGILRNFKGFSDRILDNEYSKIIQLDIAGALEEAFQKKQSKGLRTVTDFLTVALQNDGDIDSAGLAFGILNVFPATGEDELREQLKSKPVIVIKAGTGTAGAFLDHGEIKGLNEFGKLIVNLGGDNSSNIGRSRNIRWPTGDANKFFSMSTFREILTGVPLKAVKEVTGRDISFLIKAQGKGDRALESEDLIMKFGALELVSMAGPNIEWGDIFEQDGKMKDITICYYPDESGYKIVPNENKKIDRHTMYHLASEPLIGPLSLGARIPIEMRDLLKRLGENRIARLNLEGVFEKIFQKKPDIIQSIKQIGEKLGDIVALLYDIYEMTVVVVAGGVMSDSVINKACMSGLEESLKAYQFDVRSNLNSQHEGDCKVAMSTKNRICLYSSGSNQALLGAAILGFDHFVVAQKIRELQTLAKDKPSKVESVIRFLTRDEAISFLRKNAALLRITVNEEGAISSIES